MRQWLRLFLGCQQLLKCLSGVSATCKTAPAYDMSTMQAYRLKIQAGSLQRHAVGLTCVVGADDMYGTPDDWQAAPCDRSLDNYALKIYFRVHFAGVVLLAGFAPTPCARPPHVRQVSGQPGHLSGQSQQQPWSTGAKVLACPDTPDSHYDMSRHVRTCLANRSMFATQSVSQVKLT